MRIRVATLLLLTITAAHIASAAPTLPCTAGSANETILPVSNSRMIYCVSDFGWSDTWFFNGNQSTYSSSLDVMSGDDAPNLRWSGTGGVGNGWLGPSYDRGTLQPQSTGQTNWTVAPGGATAYVAGSGNSQTRSTIQNVTAGLRITITTTVTDLTANLRFDITNINATTNITNLLIGDYFNFHPNGSATNQGTSTSDDSRNQGRVYYLDGSDPRCPAGVACLYTDGNRTRADYIANGRMWGSLVGGNVLQPIDPDNWVIGSAGSYNPFGSTSIPTSQRIWSRVENNSYSNPAPGSIWPNATARGDAAGAFQWNLGTLQAGQTVSFMITKEIVDLPEPEAAAMVFAGLALCLLARFRRSGAVADTSRPANSAIRHSSRLQ